MSGALALGLLASGSLAPGVARAASPTALPAATSTEPSRTAPAPKTERDDVLRELESREDESLASHRASGWSTLRWVVVILLLIFLFPIGLIVLIILLIVDPP